MLFELAVVSIPFLYGYLTIASIKNSVEKNTTFEQTQVSYAHFVLIIYFAVIFYNYPYEGIFIVFLLMIYTHLLLIVFGFTNKYLLSNKEKLISISQTYGIYVNSYAYFITIAFAYIMIYSFLGYYIPERAALALASSLGLQIFVYFIFL